MEVYDYLGGTLLEQTNNIPVLMTLLNDLNIQQGDDYSALKYLEGKEVPVIHSTDAHYAARQMNAPPILGMFVTPPCDSSGKARYDTWEFVMRLPSFLGFFSDKYVPLHNGFSIDLFTTSIENAFVVGAPSSAQTLKPTAVTLTNVELCAQILELGSYGESLLQGTEPWVIHTINYRHFTDAVAGQKTSGYSTSATVSTDSPGSTFQRVDLNLNVVSLRNLFFTMRPAEYINNSNYPSFSHRIRNFLENFSFQYGSSYLPEIAGVDCRARYVPQSSKGNAFSAEDSTTVSATFSEDYYKSNGCSQALFELAKTTRGKDPLISLFEYKIDVYCATFKSADIKGWTPAEAYSQYAANHIKNYVSHDQTYNTNLCGKFAGGLNLQLSKKEAVCGIDTNGLLVSLNLNFKADKVSSMVNAVLDIFAEYDSFVQIIPGVASTVTF